LKPPFSFHAIVLSQDPLIALRREQVAFILLCCALANAGAVYACFYYAEEMMMKPPLFIGKSFAKNAAGEPGALYGLSCLLQLESGPLLVLLRRMMQKRALAVPDLEERAPLIDRTCFFEMRKRDTYFKKISSVVDQVFSFILFNLMLPALPALAGYLLANSELMHFTESQHHKNVASRIFTIVAALTLVPYLALINYRRGLQVEIEEVKGTFEPQP